MTTKTTTTTTTASSADSTDVPYTGSRLFEPLTHTVGLPLDQLNFVICQSAALLFALTFHGPLSLDRVSTTTRHIASLVTGVGLGYFCFGYQISNLLVLGMLCYIAILSCNPSVVQRAVLTVAILYLSYLHLLRQIHEYGSYVVDITGPSMIAVQKVTSLAFSIHDGLGRPGDQLTGEQKKYAVRKKPSLLEFLSYVFQFQSIMCGPLVYYTDYVEFIEGTNFRRHLDSSSTRKHTPKPYYPVLEKLLTSFFFAFSLVCIGPMFPIAKLADETFLKESSMFTIMVYLVASTSVARFKYYHAWKFGEAICNASGLGFNGFTAEDKPKWDLVSSVSIVRFELSLNLREALESWNISTQTWLRRYAYERASRYRLLATYVLSAIWHGFYPGYYLTFLTGALCTQGARNARRCIRPYFQSSKLLSLLYDLITCITTRLTIAYLVFPFVLLEFGSSLKVYFRLFFYGHLGALAALFILPNLTPKSSKKVK